jgi:hypothetical protein
MGQYLIINETEVLPQLNGNAAADQGAASFVSACRSSSGDVYVWTHADNSYPTIYKFIESTKSWETIPVPLTLNVYNSAGQNQAGYTNWKRYSMGAIATSGVSGEEIHWVIPRTNNGVQGTDPLCGAIVLNLQTNAVYFSKNYSASGASIVLSGGTIPVWGSSNLGNYTLNNYHMDKLKFVTVQGNLYAVWNVSSNNFVIAKYVPSSGQWTTQKNETAVFIAAGVTIGDSSAASFEVGSMTLGVKGQYIYMGLFNGWWTGGVFFRFDTVTSTWLNLSSANAPGRWKFRQGTGYTIGNKIYFLGGYGSDNLAEPTVYSYDTSNEASGGVGVFSSTTINNIVTMLKPTNCVDIGGECLIFGGSDGTVNFSKITKFTKVLSDISNFTALYQPGASGLNAIQLNWTDSADESFYIIEKKRDGGSWVKIAEIAGVTGSGTTLSFLDRGYTDINQIDIFPISLNSNTYSYRIRAAELIIQ